MAAPIAVVGVAGTFVTVVAGAMLVHLAFGLAWYVSVLVATAVAPTDPAVVFSVLGQREVSGPSGTILEGESGANDPVGIALMASLIAAGGLSGGAFAYVGGTFVLQMGVGTAVGFDLLVFVPPHEPAVTLDRPCWIAVDTSTMQTQHPGIFAIGDTTAVTSPSGRPSRKPRSSPKRR